MNKHLEPIFETVLPAIEESDIRYWVFGGVAIAAIVGRFFRFNPDVDIFVLEDDFDRIIDLVAQTQRKLNWLPKDAELLKGKRRKREWRVNGKGDVIFSIIPVQRETEDRVRFIFWHEFVPACVLTSVRREIGNYSLVTPSVEFIKELLFCKARTIPRMKSGKTARIEKLRADAKVILTEEEFDKCAIWLDP